MLKKLALASPKLRRSVGGFTLIELMLVVAIIAFLATMAIPRYTSYFTKARQVEVAMNLASLHTAQQTYWAEHGEYSTALWGPNSIGWRPEGYNGGREKAAFYYTYGFHGPNAQEGINYFTGKAGVPAHHLGDTKAETDSFIACAAGKGTGETIDIWSINESRQLIHEST